MPGANAFFCPPGFLYYFESMILRSTIVILVFLLSMFTNLEVIQAQPVNFHHLTVKNGLNDPLVNAMVRDKYGYLWFASLGGLNRFNGTSIRRFTNVTGDSTTPFSSVPYTITCDKNGRLWIGYIHGMLEYDYVSSGFRRVHAMNETNIYAMSPDDYGKIMMVTDKGLLYYDPTHNKFEEKINRGDTLADRLMNKTRVFDVKYRNGKFLIRDS